jgi:hypothetical protein
MDREKVKLIVRNLELLVDSLKAELYTDDNVPESRNSLIYDDYDEVFEDEIE